MGRNPIFIGGDKEHLFAGNSFLLLHGNHADIASDIDCAIEVSQRITIFNAYRDSNAHLALITSFRLSTGVVMVDTIGHYIKITANGQCRIGCHLGHDIGIDNRDSHAKGEGLTARSCNIDRVIACGTDGHISRCRKRSRDGDF